MTPSSILAGRLDLEALLNRFEDAWLNGAPPALEQFLAALGHDPARGDLLEELVKIDLDHRWQRSARFPAEASWTLEAYLARFPELHDRDPVPLLAWEYRARHRWGDRPRHEDYHHRFAAHAGRLGEVLPGVDADLAREFSSGRRTPPRPLAVPAKAAMTLPTLPALTSADLLDTLQQTALLSAEQLHEITADLQHRFTAPDALVAELQRRDWLTALQAEYLLAGRGRDLVHGSYVLLERLGAGGVGQVFKAQDRARQRLVALKLIRPELLQDAEVLRRFYREIHIVGQLDHPNLVKGYDSGPIGATHCLVMEYVAGSDLAALVKETGPLSVAQACDYVRQAALGLQHAHERQLVHRDVKPSNLLVAGGQWPVASNEPAKRSENDKPPSVSLLATGHWPSATVKILDLGLARLRPTVEGEITGMVAAGQGTSMLTPAGALMIGTPDYLAPEQALDFHAADIRADIYSLGCTFFFLLTGQPPFPGGTLAQKLLWHQQAAPPGIESLRSDVSAELAQVLRRMLAKRPEDRYQTPSALAAALDKPAFRELRQPPALLRPVHAPILPSATVALEAPPRRKAARAWPRVLVLAAGCALLLLVVARPGFDVPLPATLPSVPAPIQWELLPPPQPDHLAEAWAALLAKTRPLANPEDLRQDILALRARYPGTPQALRAAELLTQLPSPLDHLDAARIPTAQRLAGQPQELVAVLGERRAQNWGDVFRLSFSPDGKTLAAGTSFDKTVRLWDLSGREPRRVSVIPGYSYVTNAVVFAPDGQSLSFIGDGCIVRNWDLPNSRQQPWAVVLGPSSSTVVSAVAFAADGKSLAYGGEDRTVHLWDLARTESRERAVLRGHTGSIGALAFALDGRTLASGASDRLIRLWDLTESPPRERAALKGHHQRVQGLAFTPNAQTLVSCANDSTVRVWDLAILKEKAVFRVANCNFVAVAMTADGQRVAACSSAGAVLWWDLEKGQKGGEFQLKAGVWSVAFAPDGRHLATGNGDGTIYILRLAELPARADG